jgi:hypothetical protein
MLMRRKEERQEDDWTERAERGMCFGGKKMWPRSIIYPNRRHRALAPITNRESVG